MEDLFPLRWVSNTECMAESVKLEGGGGRDGELSLMWEIPGHSTFSV